jgi:hypothetical protein
MINLRNYVGLADVNKIRNMTSVHPEHTDARPIPQDSLFTHAKFPVLCYSILQSSLAVSLPTVSDWSPLLPQCTLGWGPLWPLASAECPRSAPDGHHLKIVQMDPVSTLLSGCDALRGTWSVSARPACMYTIASSVTIGRKNVPCVYGASTYRQCRCGRKSAVPTQCH